MFKKETFQVILVGALIEGVPLLRKPVVIVVYLELLQVGFRENEFKEHCFMQFVIIFWNVSDLLRKEPHQVISLGLGNPMILPLVVEVHKLLTPVFSKLSQKNLYEMLVRTNFFRGSKHIRTILS